jgi:DnaJ-class molecular chaperone
MSSATVAAPSGLPAPHIPTPATEACDDCDGLGVRSFTTEWRGAVQDGEADCETCGGTGRVTITEEA